MMHLKSPPPIDVYWILVCNFAHSLHDWKVHIEEGIEKAKVVAAAWGPELIQFFAALAILHQDDLMNRMNSTRTMFGGQHWFNSLLL